MYKVVFTLQALYAAKLPSSMHNVLHPLSIPMSGARGREGLSVSSVKQKTSLNVPDAYAHKSFNPVSANILKRYECAACGTQEPS